MTKGTKERTQYLYDFCRFVCPDFLERKNPEIILRDIASGLKKYDKVDIKSFYDQGCKFVTQNPDGVVIEEDIPLRGRGMHPYREKASRLIEKYTGICLPVTAIVPSTLYEAIINHCLINAKDPRAHQSTLEDLYL